MVIITIDNNYRWLLKSYVLYLKRNIYIGSSSITYVRKVYSITDIARDVGGVANVLLVFFSTFMAPFSYFSFITKAISHFYYAKTDEKNLFVKVYKRN